MATATKEVKSEKKEKKPEVKMLTTRDLAERIGCKPAVLRRYLRTLPQYQDDGYSRYKWDPDKDVKKMDDIVKNFSKFAEGEKEKNKKRLEELKKKGKDSKQIKGKAKAADEDEDEGEEEEEELD